MSYDYDSPAKIIDLFGTEIPEDKEELNSFIKSHNLNHGDVIQTTDFRMLDAKIVSFNEAEEKFELVNSLDETDAGYLTVPLEVTKAVKSALRKYKSLFQNINNFDLWLAPSDEFVKIFYQILLKIGKF